MTTLSEKNARQQRLRAKTKITHCEACGLKAWVPRELDVHHVLPKASGGDDEPENVVVLCPTCHRRAHIATPQTRVLTIKGNLPERHCRHWSRADLLEALKAWDKSGPPSEPDVDLFADNAASGIGL